MPARIIARVRFDNLPPMKPPARRPEKMKTPIVARDDEDGHQLTRFVRTDAESFLPLAGTVGDRSGRGSSVTGRRRERGLQRLLQSAPKVKKNDQSLPRKERQRRRHSVRSRPLSPFEGSGDSAVRIRSAAQRRATAVEAFIWIAGYLLAILGLLKAASSEQPLFWLAVWPAPVALASTIFIFFRQGFHFRNGVLVLGRRRG
jgi:hypothetical protein